MKPATCSSRRRSCRGGERGDAEFSPSGFHPSRASPTGRRIAGCDYKTEAIQGPRADNHAHSREMKKVIFPRGGVAGENTKSGTASRGQDDPKGKRKRK